MGISLILRGVDRSQLVVLNRLRSSGPIRSMATGRACLRSLAKTRLIDLALGVLVDIIRMVVQCGIIDPARKRVRVMRLTVRLGRLVQLRRRQEGVLELYQALVGWALLLVIPQIQPLVASPAQTRIRGMHQDEWCLYLLVQGRLV